MAKAISRGETKDLSIEVDCDTCIGCGTCTVLAPQTFELDNNLKSKVKTNPKDDKDTIVGAAQSCAVDAIKIIDKKNGKQIHP